MHKENIIAFISGAILIAIVAYVFVMRNADEKDVVMPQVTEDVREIEAEYEIVTREEIDDFFNMTLEYPTFGIASIDQSISTFINTSVRDFRSMGIGIIPGRKHILAVEVKEVFIDASIISVLFLVYQDAGGAHGLGFMTGKNYERQSGRELGVTEALALIDETLWSLSERATTHFRGVIGEALFEDGLAPRAENFKSFTITADAVTFHFSPYQIAAYALGPQEFSIARTR